MVSPPISDVDHRCFLRGAAGSCGAAALSESADSGSLGAPGSGSGSTEQVSVFGIPQAGPRISQLLADCSNMSGHANVKCQYFLSEQYVALLATAVRSGLAPNLPGPVGGRFHSPALFARHLFRPSLPSRPQRSRHDHQFHRERASAERWRSPA